MAKDRRIEVVEIPVERVAYVPGGSADRVGRGQVWSKAWQAAIGGFARLTAVDAPPMSYAGAPFRRLIDVPGAQLPAALDTWWRHAAHDDGHLRLDAPSPVRGSWSLG